MFLFEKIDKNVQFNLLFLGIPQIFLCVRVRQVVVFYLRNEKKLSVLSSVLLTVSTLEMCIGKHIENRRDQT